MNKHVATTCLLLACATQSSIACKCAPPPPPREAITNANVVFVGTVISGHISGEYERQYEFKVTEVVKGDIGETVTVFTALNGAICGYNFNIGTEYLVYASGPNDKLRTTICTRTKYYMPYGKTEVEELKQKP